MSGHTRITSSFLKKNRTFSFPLICLAGVLCIVFLSGLSLKDFAIDFYLWWFSLFLFGLVAFPFAARLFPHSRSKGYGFSKAIGLLSSSLILWTFSYLNILPFSRLSIILVFILLAIFAWIPDKNRKAALSVMSERTAMLDIAWNEILFVLVLILLCLIKGTRPDIAGEEKFMNFAFLNALMRTDTLPAPDPWMAGESINYYYHGQYIYAFLNKFNGIKTGISYTLSLCTSIALLFNLAYALGTLFFESAIQKGLKARKFLLIPVGLLSGLMVTFFGNSHSFFYNPDALGHRFIPVFEKMGIDTGQTDHFFYPNSTRFIGHNPDSEVWSHLGELIEQGDYTIHEFPFYSFLIGDLHAHVAGTLIVMLIIAFLFQYVTQSARQGAVCPSDIHETSFSVSFKKRARCEALRLFNPYVIGVGFLLGISIMANYWDFLIYFILSAMAILVAHTFRTNRFVTLFGFCAFALQIIMILVVYTSYAHLPVFHLLLLFIVLIISVSFSLTQPCALTQTGASMALLFTLANLTALPFQIHFDMISSALAMVENRSSFFQLLILWGTHIIFALTILVFVIMNKSSVTNDSKNKEQQSLSEVQAVTRFFRKRNPTDIFISGTVVVSFLLLLAPEIFYVVDIYSGSYKRANTMFKFTFQAFILLSLVVAYTLFRIYSHKKPDGKHSRTNIVLSILLTLILFIPAAYTIPATKQWTRVHQPLFEIDAVHGGFSSLVTITVIIALVILIIRAYTNYRAEKRLELKKIIIAALLSVVLILPTVLPKEADFPGLRIHFAFEDSYQGLDGTASIQSRSSASLDHSDMGALRPYALAIDYLNENVSGITHICEVYGYSYTDYCIVSAYTGLPTIFGWQTHQWLWRFQGIYSPDEGYIQNPDKPDLWNDIINPRKNAVDQIYTSHDITLVRYLLDQFSIEYIVVGPLERQTYQRTMRAENYDPNFILGEVIDRFTDDAGVEYVTISNLNDDMLIKLGTVAFETESLYIIRVDAFAQ